MKYPAKEVETVLAWLAETELEPKETHPNEDEEEVKGLCRDATTALEALRDFEDSK